MKWQKVICLQLILSKQLEAERAVPDKTEESSKAAAKAE